MEHYSVYHTRPLFALERVGADRLGRTAEEARVLLRGPNPPEAKYETRPWVVEVQLKRGRIH